MGFKTDCFFFFKFDPCECTLTGSQILTCGENCTHYHPVIEKLSKEEIVEEVHRRR